MNLSNDDTMTLGDYCENLFGEEAFNTLVRHAEQSAFQSFQNTPPNDKSGREQAYFELNGLRNFLGMMEAIMNRRDEILQEIEASLSSSDDAIIDE